MKETIHCIKCKRPILDHEINEGQGIVYCHGCNYYFPITEKTTRTREEIVVPNGADYIRLRIEEDELEIKIRWLRNYSFERLILNNLIAIEGAVFIALAFTINKTIVEVNSKHIKITHKPFDVLPMTFYPATYVKQLYVKQLHKGFWKKKYFSSYGLYAILKTGEHKLLLWDLRERTLLFMEQEIERVLKIEDQEV